MPLSNMKHFNEDQSRSSYLVISEFMMDSYRISILKYILPTSHSWERQCCVCLVLTCCETTSYSDKATADPSLALSWLFYFNCRNHRTWGLRTSMATVLSTQQREGQGRSVKVLDLKPLRDQKWRWQGQPWVFLSHAVDIQPTTPSGSSVYTPKFYN